MKAEDPLRVLAALPRPRLSPFFPARVTARATSEARAPARSRLMRLYWLVLACVAGSVLSETWGGVGALAFVGASLAFPVGAVRLLLVLAGGISPCRSPTAGPSPPGSRCIP